MRSLLVLGTAMLMAGTSGAFAASSSSQASSSNMNVKQEIEKKLSSDGYSNVSVVPSSFIVKAKDKQGSPVMMVIGPDSVMEVTEAPSSKSSTGGQSSSK